jgi:hypothetical protein
MFCSSSGRRNLQAMIFAFLLAGPCQNIIFNSKEMARSFGCSAELTYNLTKEYKNLVFAPFRNAILGAKVIKKLYTIYFCVILIYFYNRRKMLKLSWNL